MFKVIKLKEDSYQIKTPTKTYEGNTRHTVLTMHDMGVDWDDIEFGLTSMLNNNHSVAEYGINKTFIFSST